MTRKTDRMDCPFCDLSSIADVEWCATLAGGVGEVYRFPPLNPVTPGHMLFVPKGHWADATADPMVTGKVFEMAAWYTRSRGIEANLITSVGPAASQTVRHLHVHYVPRRPGDGLRLPWTDQLVPPTEDDA